MAEILTIDQKCKAVPIAVASPADFSCRTSVPIDPNVVLRDPNISLYCLDHARRQALFVETDDGYATAEEPFLYLAQYNRAQRLLAVPYGTLAHLADAIAGSAAPLALIHSPGRSGSTLLSKAFQRVEATTSLTEPDIYTQIVQMRAQGSPATTSWWRCCGGRPSYYPSPLSHAARSCRSSSSGVGALRSPTF